MLLPHFDVLCDLLLNRRTATWNIFVLYNQETNYYSFFISKSCAITQKPTFVHFVEHEKAILRNLLSIQNEVISLVATIRYIYQRIVIGPEKSCYCQTWLKGLLMEWKLTAKAELNWEIYKS